MSYSLSINQHVPFLKQWGLKVFSSRNNFWIIFVNVKSSFCSKTKVKYKIIQHSKESFSYIVLRVLFWTQAWTTVFRSGCGCWLWFVSVPTCVRIWHLFRSNIYRDGFYYRLQFKIKRTQQVKERQHKWE